MNENDVPDDIKNFILQHIDSIEQLTILLLLYADPKREWTSRSIENHLRSSAASVGKRLSDLYSRGILAKPNSDEDRHLYSPKTEEMAARIEKLAAFHAKYSNRVIALIYSRPLEVLRNFADAFLIGKKEDQE
jgi:hypothetical protein